MMWSSHVLIEASLKEAFRQIVDIYGKKTTTIYFMSIVGGQQSVDETELVDV